MKKFMRKAVAMVCVSAMAMGALTACGGSDAPADAGDGDEAAATFFVGGIGPVTGGAAIYGQSVRNGAEMAVEEINAAGGVNGMMFEFDYQDDEHDPEKAVNAYNTLKDKGMKMLMGTVTSNPCIAVADYTKADNMFQLTPSGSAVAAAPYDNTFRLCFTDPAQGAASARYIGENGVATKVAAIYDSSDAYSSGIYESFVAEAANQGLEIVTAQAFTADSKTDFSVQLQKIQESAPELVFLPIYYQEAALIVKQASTANMEMTFFGCDGLDGIIPQLGDDVALADGVMLLTPFVADAADEMTQTFVATYQEKYDMVPTQFAADGYDCMYALAAAMEQGNVTADMEVSEICEIMKVAMTEVTVDGLTGTMTWTADGECDKTPKAMVVKDGAYTAAQ